ncbi:MAG: hypothetical protein ACOYMR_16320, partial [Ilumatobacteraceae bacterium]
MSVWTVSYGRGLGLVADGSFEDPTNARTIQLAALGLVAIAVLLGIGTWWWWKQSKAEHPALGPLEVMGTKKWWKSDFTERRRRLEAVRPPHDDEQADAPVPLDLDHVMTRDDPHSFDDLLDPTAAESAEAAEAVDAVAPADPAGPEDPAAPLEPGEPVDATADRQDAPIAAAVAVLDGPAPVEAVDATAGEAAAAASAAEPSAA